MTYISHAKWPRGVVNLGNTENESTDTHGSREQAEVVCRLLEQNGFGGDRQIYPIRTWITEGEQ